MVLYIDFSYIQLSIIYTPLGPPEKETSSSILFQEFRDYIQATFNLL